MAVSSESSNLQRCAYLVEEAARSEATAHALDGSGRASEAIAPYGDAIGLLQDAFAFCPDWHRDKPVIGSHLQSVRKRVAYLEGLRGAPVLLPCESHLEPKQLTISSDQGSRGSRTMTFMVFMGATTGLLAAGPRVALLLAAGLAHTVTRDDSAGHLARLLGQRGSDSFAWAAHRASGRLRRLDLAVRIRHQTSLMRLGEAVFVVRSAAASLVGLAPWRRAQKPALDDASTVASY